MGHVGTSPERRDVNHLKKSFSKGVADKWQAHFWRPIIYLTSAGLALSV